MNIPLQHLIEVPQRLLRRPCLGQLRIIGSEKKLEDGKGWRGRRGIALIAVVQATRRWKLLSIRSSIALAMMVLKIDTKNNN